MTGCSATSLLIDPFGDQCGFAEAGWGGDEGQSATQLEALVEPFDQLGPRNQLRPQRGDIQFRLKQRFRHQEIIGRKYWFWYFYMLAAKQ